MAHFSNGTAFRAYEEQYCDRCVHRPTEDVDGNTLGCVVSDAHFAYGHDMNAREVLDMLIPMEKGGLFPDQCRMFIEGDPGSVPPPADHLNWMRP